LAFFALKMYLGSRCPLRSYRG